MKVILERVDMIEPINKDDAEMMGQSLVLTKGM
jgi:hypothetical protein